MTNTHLLTADLCARAVIAASRALRLDPIVACQPGKSPLRRSIAPAASAIALATGRSQREIAKVLGLGATTIPHAAQREGFLYAKTQASIAIGGAALANAPIADEPPPARADDEPIEGDFVVVVAAANEVRAVAVDQTVEVPRKAAETPSPRTLSFSSPKSRLGRRPRPTAVDYASRHTSPEDQALIAAALAKGKLTLCDARVAGGVEILGLQLKPVDVDHGAFSWRVQKDRKLAAKRGSAVR